MALKKEILELKLIMEGVLASDPIPAPFLDLMLVKIENLKHEIESYNPDSESISETKTPIPPAQISEKPKPITKIEPEIIAPTPESAVEINIAKEPEPVVQEATLEEALKQEEVIIAEQEEINNPTEVQKSTQEVADVAEATNEIAEVFKATNEEVVQDAQNYSEEQQQSIVDVVSFSEELKADENEIEIKSPKVEVEEVKQIKPSTELVEPVIFNTSTSQFEEPSSTTNLEESNEAIEPVVESIQDEKPKAEAIEAPPQERESTPKQVVEPKVETPPQQTEPVEEKKKFSDRFRIDRKVSQMLGGKERISEQLEQKKITDLRKAIPLVDRFRFQRELFKNDPDLYTAVIESVNNSGSLSAAQDILMNKIDIQSETGEEFVAIVKRLYI